MQVNLANKSGVSELKCHDHLLCLRQQMVEILCFQVIHPAVNKVCMTRQLFIQWRNFNETSDKCSLSQWESEKAISHRIFV